MFFSQILIAFHNRHPQHQNQRFFHEIEQNHRKNIKFGQKLRICKFRYWLTTLYLTKKRNLSQEVISQASSTLEIKSAPKHQISKIIQTYL